VEVYDFSVLETGSSISEKVEHVAVRNRVNIKSVVTVDRERWASFVIRLEGSIGEDTGADSSRSLVSVSSAYNSCSSLSYLIANILYIFS
jgi:hypothetical protein